ncbi:MULTISPECIES: hypothetical protein [Streptomycetaceae]|uniref:hypothetical protein n=1 Tax=Streptomycetaceae TaxID=2062 RepID=UPI00037DBE30|nr:MULTISPECIES: hypothetical protein [Streptomycetaceae]MDX2853360.1 hypothetical protein [Streptomyces sp. PA03-3a]MYX39429.1 hypothetical protein [Streptomyces sp. SID8377]
MGESGYTERWLETGSGPGAVVRARVTQANQAVQAAYRTWLDHATECPTCRDGAARDCTVVQPLWDAYQAAQRAAL